MRFVLYCLLGFFLLVCCFGFFGCVLILAVNMDAESGNLMDIMVFHGKTEAQSTDFISREPSV